MHLSGSTSVPAHVLIACSVLACLVPPASAQTVDAGPHAVGFRVLEAVDFSRSIGPKRDYTGHLEAGNDAMPLPIGVWYPAEPGTGEAMAYGTYLALAQAHKRGSFGPITDADRDAALGLPNGIAEFAFGGPLTTAQVRAILEQPAGARREAQPADGAFPLVAASLYGVQSANLLAEHLASHGYVVATGPMRPEVIRQQVTEGQIAIETQSRNLEFVIAQVRALPFVDHARMGLLGLNFDGFAALTVQMRNMQADAVVSLDGWHDKRNGAATLREVPYFDVLRMRVPYLAMTQANPPRDDFAPDFTNFDALKYAERTFYVVHDFEHHHYIGDLLAWPHLRAAVEPAYAFVYGAIRRFFDAHVKGDRDTHGDLQEFARENASLIELSRQADALPAVPTRERFAGILESDPAEAARIYRGARRQNPDLDLVSMRTLNLMVFRARSRDDHEDVVALNRLKTEVFPESSRAFYDLGAALEEAGGDDEAAYRSALDLLESDPDLSADERIELRRRIMERLER